MDEYLFDEIINNKIDKALKNIGNRKIGVIVRVEEDGIKIKFDGEEKDRTKLYKRLESYDNPNAGDRVVMDSVNGVYIILGKIT